MFVNLTPHAVVFRTPDADVTVAPSGAVARVSTTPARAGLWRRLTTALQALWRKPSAPVARTVAGLPVRVKAPLGAVVGLPDPDGVSVFVVSGLVLGALQAQGSTRLDVVAPATGPNDNAVRNDAGHVVAVTQLDGLA